MTDVMCHGCGSDRIVLDTEPGSVVFECPVCGISREEVIENPC
jgi:predicted RNA-binding Zn-ribbon protein involved in translation (DUF1610 family)